jgi:hypothetical protein
MKAALIAIAALVVVAGVGLVLMMSGGGSAPTTKTSTGSATPTTVATPDVPALPTPAPSLGSSATGSDGAKEYMVGDVKVRDHRSGSNAPMDIPPNAHPANSRDLPSDLTHDISQQVRKVIFDCAAAVPKDAKGEKPRVVGQLVVAIKDHKLSITSEALETRDISDDAAATALKQCTQEKSAGFTSSAKDQADVTDYAIQLNFAIP